MPLYSAKRPAEPPQSLDTPLKRRRDRRASGRSLMSQLPLGRITLAMVGVIALGVGLRIALVDDPMGGRPSAEAPITSTLDANPVAIETGRPATITADPEMVELLPMDGPVLPEADARGIYADLAEQSSNGPLPRIGSDGRTPFHAYSRASVSPGSAGGRPLIGLVVTGLGLNEAGTLEAIETLPDTVSLAFAPYGGTLASTTAAARAEGHEMFLEVPLEPFDYPDNDPGPDTLLTGQTPRQNIERLNAVMASFGGYAGLINHMGARFTASADAFGPVMEEIGARGLGYLDDGSSNRSIAAQLASGNKVPFARVSAIIDNDPSRTAILAALDALEAKARSEGSAIGLFSALPVSIRAVAEWSRAAEERGFVLVPASALMK